MVECFFATKDCGASSKDRSRHGFHAALGMKLHTTTATLTIPFGSPPAKPNRAKPSGFGSGASAISKVPQQPTKTSGYNAHSAPTVLLPVPLLSILVSQHARRFELHRLHFTHFTPHVKVLILGIFFFLHMMHLQVQTHCWWVWRKSQLRLGCKCLKLRFKHFVYNMLI